MKKVIFSSAIALSAVTLLAGPVLAAEGVAVSSSKGDITLERKTGEEGEEKPELVDPTDPTNPKPVFPGDEENESGEEEGSKGPLSIDYISYFHFPKQKISGNTKTYFAALDKIKDDMASEAVRDTPNFVQVTDDRGSNAGWELTVKQSKAFTGKATGHVLEGATLAISNLRVSSRATNLAPKPIVNPATITLSASTEEAKVMGATKDAGMGSWVAIAGDNITGSESVALTIPGNVKKEADKYEAVLTWTLKDEPSK